MSGSQLVLPVGLSPDSSWWYHEDPNGISEAIDRAMRRALSKDWKSGTLADRVRDFRGYLVARSWIVARLTGRGGASAEGEDPGKLIIEPSYPATDVTERARAARLIGATGLLLAKLVPGFDSWTPPRLFVTGRQETTFPPAIVVAIVAIENVAIAAAVAYCANQAAQVVDNWLARDTAVQELAKADAQALQVLDRHVTREKEAGAALPLDAASTKILDGLSERQKGLVGALQRPKVEPLFPEWGWPAVGVAAAVAAVVVFSR